MKLDYQFSKDEWKAAAEAIKGTIAGAARAAFQDLAKQVQREGRAEIAHAGFSKRWQNGFRAYVFPRRAEPLSKQLVMRGQHAINYANIFERGGLILHRVDADVRSEILVLIPDRRFREQRGSLDALDDQHRLVVGESVDARRGLDDHVTHAAQPGRRGLADVGERPRADRDDASRPCAPRHRARDRRLVGVDPAVGAFENDACHSAVAQPALDLGQQLDAGPSLRHRVGQDRHVATGDLGQAVEGAGADRDRAQPNGIAQPGRKLKATQE